MLTRKLAAGVAFVALAMAASGAYAQQTTGSIRGHVTDESGKPVAGATITVTHIPTGAASTTLSAADGSYDVPNLRPGGPYTVQAADSAHAAVRIDVPSVGLGAATSLNIAMTAAAQVGEITVTASAAGGAKELTTGPVSTFTARDIETLPSFTRDLKDLVRLNPFVTIDPTNSDALVVAGDNNRVNSIYIDGVKQADDFGLNGNGYPSQRSPISIDWVKDFNFEVAPYDVDYGDFQGGVLNIVTKEGTNRFHGEAYYQWDSSDIAGSHFVQDDGADQRTVKIQPFFDQTWGLNLGGPIIPDKLFFFAGYENYITARPPSFYGPEDSNAPNKVFGLTTSELDQITSILKNVYHYDPLSYTANSLPETDKKYFARIDWNITDRQRLMISYQEDDGVTLLDGGFNSNKELSLLSQYYNYDQSLQVYNAQLFSQWNDQFSTEIAYSHKEVDSISTSLAGNDFAQFLVRLDPTPDNPSGASVVLGPNLSRQANQLRDTDQLFRFRAHYRLRNHVFTFGYERESLSVFNLFDQNANGSYTFASDTTATSGVACYPGYTVLQDLAMGAACAVTYDNAASNVKTDAAANWSDVDNITYLQDEWAVTPDFTLRLGVRDEFYTDATPVPLNTTGFLNVYGFGNTATFQGRGVIMPRAGFNWRPDDSLTLSGGFGLFSGGDPNVWLSNSYSNTGLLIGLANCSLSASKTTPGVATSNCPAGALTGVDALTGTPLVTGVVQGINTTSANTGTGVTNAIDPHFKLPSTWKASLSLVKTFGLPYVGDGWRFHADVLYQQVNEGVTWKDLNAARNVLGAAPDGRPTYDNNRFKTCGGTTVGSHSCYSLLLTNDQAGGGLTWAVGLGKGWDDGWARGLDFDLTYTHSNVGDVNPGTSSVALSNYSEWAISDRNAPITAPSDYNIKWQAKLSVGYSHAFFGDYKTSVRLFMEDRAGFPFSYTFFSTANNNANAGDQMFGEDAAVAFRNTELLYVPKADAAGNVTAASDPRVTYNPSTFGPAVIARWNAYLHQTGLIRYAGQIAPRNAFDSPDVLTGDIRFEQELPAFLPNHAKLLLWFDIVNFPNLLNDKWGVLAQTGFPGVVSPITARNCQANAPTKTTCAAGAGNFYQYDSLFTTTLPRLDNSSDWYMDLGVKYEF